MRTTLKMWLYLIPKGDRRIAYHAWKAGALRFAKFPVSNASYLKAPESAGKATGPPRPLLCPEPPPDGSHFELTWNSGVGWMSVSLRDQVLICTSPLLYSARQMHESSARDISFAETNMMLPHQREVVRKALDEAAKTGASSDAIALAFLAGVLVSSYSTMNKLRPTIIQGTRMASGRKSSQDVEWSEIIEAAIERHGKVTPLSLLKILGGKREFDKRKREKPLNFMLDGADGFFWDYRPVEIPPIEWQRFSRLVSKKKDRMD